MSCLSRKMGAAQLQLNHPFAVRSHFYRGDSFAMPAQQSSQPPTARHCPLPPHFFTSCRVGSLLVMLGASVEIAAIDRWADLRVFSAVLVLGGLVMYFAGRILDAIEHTNRPAEDAWEDGYEIGFNKGWLERDEQARAQHAVTHLRAVPAIIDNEEGDDDAVGRATRERAIQS